MMLKTLEKSGKTEEAAIAAALEELGLDRMMFPLRSLSAPSPASSASVPAPR